MQFKLLQTYRTISNFAISLIMEFIPFIILDYAKPVYGLEKALMLMFCYWAVQNLFIVLFNYLLKKYYFKSPQIFLLLRIIPIVACEICILFLSSNAIWLIILTAMFSGLENSFNYSPIDIIYNYVSEGADEKTLGFTKFLDQMGWLIAGIVGGFFLDNISQTIVIIFSLAMFIASAAPLFVFYFKFKNTENFNADFISYLIAQDENNKKVKKIKKSFLLKHFITYFLSAPFAYLFYYISSTVIYLRTGSFFIEGLVNALYDGIYGIACLVIGKILTKIDGGGWATAVGVFMLGSMCVVMFVQNVWIISIAYLLCAIIQPFHTMHLYQGFLDKARILGVGNTALINQGSAEALSYSVVYFSGCFGGFVWPVAAVAGVFAIASIIIARKAESSTTKDLVNYLNHNE